MAKKIILGLALALVVAGGVFAQEEALGSAGIKNWISGEVSILGGGVRYERMLTDKMSIGANAYWTTLIFFADLEVGASFRYYVWKQLLFVGGGLGFHMHRGTYKYDYEYSYYDYDWYYGYSGVRRTATGSGTWFGYATGVAISPEVGFRIDVGDTPGGFFLQPGIKIPITFGVVKFYLDWGEEMTGSKFRVGVGVVPYLGLGYAW